MPSQPARIALLGDVHANLPALEAVLTHAGGLGVESIWNIGDFVGYGAFPNEVVQRMRKMKAISIIGNYDLKVLNFPQKDKKWRKKKHPLKWMAFKWTYDHLSDKSLQYLRTLPEERWLKIGRREFLLVHGSPASNEELIGPDTPEERLQVLSYIAQEKNSSPVDAIIFGHSHQAFARQVNDTWFVNTGSVGRPDDGDPRACYAILDISADGLQFHHYRLDYDIGKAVSAIREKGLPEAFAQMIIKGRDLDTVLKGRPT